MDLQALIRRMVRDNLTWGEERITNDFLLKLCLQVSPRTVRQYMPKRLEHGRGNRAQAIVACDFCVVVPRDLSSPVCLCTPGTRDSTYPAHQCDGTPHSPVDIAAA